MKKQFRQKVRRGFTLIELMIVVAIIGILAAVAVPNFIRATDEAKIARIRADLATIGTATELYYAKHGSYPTSLSTLADKTDGYLKSVPEPPQDDLSYTAGSDGEWTCTFKGVTYSSYGTSSET